MFTPHVKLKCQYRATYYADDGDSGSPVFQRITTKHVRLIGVHWGYRESDNTSVFSPLRSIRDDLGNFNALDPETDYIPPSDPGDPGDPGDPIP